MPGKAERIDGVVKRVGLLYWVVQVDRDTEPGNSLLTEGSLTQVNN